MYSYAKSEVAFQTKYFVQKELDIRGSRNAMPEDFRAVIHYLQNGNCPMNELISAVVKPEEAGEALQKWSENPGKVFRMLVEFLILSILIFDITMKALNNKTAVKAVRPERIIQFGEGNFLRAFVDWIISNMNEKTDFNSSVVVVQPIDKGMVDALNAQDCLYHVNLQGLNNGEVVELIQND